MSDPLIWVRLIHFAATMAVTGAIFFHAFVAAPAFLAAKAEGGVAAGMRRTLAAINWISLAVAVASGAAWLILQSAQMLDLPLTQALSEGAAWTVLSETDFGQAWALRLILAVLLAASLPWLAASRPGIVIAIVLSTGLVGTLAWGGHAVAGTGVEGGVHLVADILHLIAAAAWVGALLPLALLLRAALTAPDLASLAGARVAVQRFSVLGVVSVGTLLLSGLFNSWVLAGSIPALTSTDYGRLLLAKIALFLVMLLFAAANRYRLTPQLASSSGIDAVRRALGQIRRNTLIEAALGAVVILIVSILGTLPPGLEALE